MQYASGLLPVFALSAVIFAGTFYSGSLVAQDQVQSLPRGATEIRVNGQVYYYAGGYYYRRQDRGVDGGYLRVEPPLGAEVGSIPYGSGKFAIGDDQYFLSGTGTFYQYNRRNNSYTVVPPPDSWRNYYVIPRGYRAPPIYFDTKPLAGESQFEAESLYNEQGQRIYRDSPIVPKAVPPGYVGDPRGDYSWNLQRDRDRRYSERTESQSYAERIESERINRERERYQNRNRGPGTSRDPAPFASVRPNTDYRALRESFCRQTAADNARRLDPGTRDDYQVRIFKRKYRDCMQRMERQRR